MFRKITKSVLLLTLILPFAVAQAADDTLFSTNLYVKFQAKACTNCHDFHEAARDGMYFNSHGKRREVNRCRTCHTRQITGFENVADWFARPGLYTSGLGAKETCEATKKALNAEFKSDELLAGQLEKHLFEDPRVLWGIDGATANSGRLPFDRQETNLVKGGLEEWKTQVTAWIKGGMKCE